MAEVLTEGKAYKQILGMFGEDNLFMNPRDIPPTEIIRSPSAALDRALGVGGWPRGRLIQIAGMPSSGKTLLSLLSMAIWQRMHPDNCGLFIDAEYTYDPDWAEMLGIDNDRVILVKTNNGVDIFTGLVGVTKKLKTGKFKHTMGLLDMVKTGQVISMKTPSGKLRRFDLSRLGVVTLDSIASIQTPTEAASAVGKANIAATARFLTTELKKLTPVVANANVVMFGLNHVKVKVGETYGNPESTPGGRAWKHACSIMLMVAPSLTRENTILNAHEERIGHLVRARITKNKVASPFKKAEYFVEYTKGIVRKEIELFEAGLMVDLFDRPSKVRYQYAGQDFVGREKMINFIKDNLDTVEEDLRSKYLGSDADENQEFEPDEVEVPENPFNQED